MSSSDEPQKVDVNKHAISLAFSKLSSKTIYQQTTNRASKTTEKISARINMTNNRKKKKNKFSKKLQRERNAENSQLRLTFRFPQLKINGDNKQQFRVKKSTQNFNF